MSNIVVSVILPTYNRGYIIKKAIDSVINQTYENWELIIIDDASDDDTERVVCRYDDARVKYQKNTENKGANYSRNWGCQMACGEYLAFLDSDNCWTPDKLEKQVKALEKSEDDIAIVFSREQSIDAEKQTVIPDEDFQLEDLSSILREKNVIDTNTVLMKKEILDKVGGFDNDMPRLQDWDLFFRTIVVYQFKALYLKEILDYNFLQDNSISKNIKKQIIADCMFLKKYKTYMGKNNIETRVRNLIGSVGKIDFQDDTQIYAEDILVQALLQGNQQMKYYETLFRWKNNLENSVHRTIFEEFMKDKSKKIAIYGLGGWGEAIYSEMTNVGIKISYGIDQCKKEFHDLQVFGIEELPSDIDIIIVSVFQQYKKIKGDLRKYYSGTILSIEQIINRDF